MGQPYEIRNEVILVSGRIEQLEHALNIRGLINVYVQEDE